MAFESIRAPLLTSVSVERGITAVLSAVPPPYVIANTTFQPLVAVQAGKETPVPVQITATPLPPNANIESVLARVHVANASGAATQDHVGVNITGGAAPGQYDVAVDQPVRPRNVQLKLKDGEVFWTFGGGLTAIAYDLPDFALALNTYLDKANLTAPVTELPFVLTSDAPGQVGIEIQELHYSQVKTQTWSNPLDSTTRVDRNLGLSFGAVAMLPLDPLTEQPGQVVQLQSLRLDVGGQFGPDRLLGNIEVHDGRQFATISSDYALAQRFMLSGALVQGTCRCTGLTGFFTADARAELYVALQRDANGTPASDAPLAQANLTFTPPDTSDTPQPWTFATFAAAVELQTEVAYWMVVKGVRGSVRLGLQAAPQGDATTLPVLRDALVINRGGQRWKSMFRTPPTPSIVALLGIVYVPGSDDQTAAVQLTVTGAPAAGTPVGQRLDPGREPQTVTLNTGGVHWNHVRLEIRSHAEGTLSLANVIRAYRLV
jgi:hypothetical protein